MPTAAEVFRDRILSHQVGLQRLSHREIREAVRILKRAELRIYRQLRRRLRIAQVAGFDRGPQSTIRLRQMLAEIREILEEAYREIGAALQLELFELSAYEADYLDRMLRASIPRDARPFVSFGKPTPELLRAIITDSPFQNGLLREYFAARGRKSLVAQAMRRYRAVLQEFVEDGILAGETVETIVRRLRARVTGIGEAHLKATVDTAIKHVAQTSRDRFLDANAGPGGVVKGYQWLSTLDTRTTLEYCVPRDGKEYDTDRNPVGHSYPWGEGPGRIHFRCRSGSTAVLKSWKDLGIDAKELSGATRASMNGQVARGLTAEQWLRSLSRADLDRVFGETRAGLFASGELSVRDMVKDRGGLWTLAELREREGVSP